MPEYGVQWLNTDYRKKCERKTDTKFSMRLTKEKFGKIEVSISCLFF